MTTPVIWMKINLYWALLMFLAGVLWAATGNMDQAMRHGVLGMISIFLYSFTAEWQKNKKQT